MTLIGAVYEVHTPGGFPPMFGSRFAELRPACRRADELDGYVIDLRTGWTVVYQSPGYMKKFPTGGGADSPTTGSRVEPPASLWMDGGRPDWVSMGDET